MHPDTFRDKLDELLLLATQKDGKFSYKKYVEKYVDLKQELNNEYAILYYSEMNRYED